ncbi:PhzF family phenazine biosynthesis protein [Psychrobacter sp. I-STPA6b]|uniref:PhzF family phenazine biosynthesis protein n=1 Tax=Psychrobacter sp. I-STPA6b TaxID=2585718 RepID=UPI001D0CAC24|nr:PhzF family phenazine biosynthesis protein [Psychrobacter sp. I-STPA6b]
MPTSSKLSLPIYHVDAFTNQVFSGNPACVVPLTSWLDDEILQNIASENNLSETAFIVKNTEQQTDNQTDYHLRWFTPVSEVALCGHATLATAHVLFTHLGFAKDTIRFHSHSGILTVSRCQLNDNPAYMLDFPAIASTPMDLADVPADLITGLNLAKEKVVSVSLGTNYLIEVASQTEVEQISPIISHWQNLGVRGITVTAQAQPSSSVDIVSRCFYPETVAVEDPVTGSAHCQLMPYWVDKLGKNKLLAMQLSKRQGLLDCELVQSPTGNRVKLIGQAVDYMVGKIHFSS